MLPWRSDPSPYKVWISEIMLQQTRVDTVIPYFNRFIEELPSVSHLAEVEDERLFKLWQGLGYYRRATYLKQAAKIIVERYDGQIPCRVNDLLALPGIGAYTAGAIASIAFNMPIPAVDGNVLRVVARVNADSGDIRSPEVKTRIEKFIKAVIPDHLPGDFNQGMMDLGAQICLPNGEPKCRECPMNVLCEAYSKGIVASIPVKNEKKTRKIQEKTVLVVQRNDRMAIQKRGNKGLLANLWELPNFEGFLTEKQCVKLLKSLGFSVVNIAPITTAKHQFTHIEWVMKGYSVSVEEKENKSDWKWVRKEEVENTYSIPTAFQAFLPYS